MIDISNVTDVELETKILDYTEDDFRQMSDDDLKRMYLIARNMQDRQNTRQLTKKVLINGLYGAISKSVFLYYNIFIAAAITANGRYLVQKSSQYIEDRLQSKIKSDRPYVVYNDTDSIYYHFEPYMELFEKKHPEAGIKEKVDFAIRFTNEFVQPAINQSMKDFAYTQNLYRTDYLGCKREIIADVLVFTGKKHYYGRKRADEALVFPEDSPEIKVTGLDIVKSTCPVFTKKMIYKNMDLFLDGTERQMKDWLNEIKLQYMHAEPADISNVGACSSLDYQLGQKGIPFGVRAALVYNKYIKDHHLENQYNLIQAGDKCKRLFLRTPNIFGSEIIAYPDDKFANKVLRPMIDYETQFQKGFLSMVKLMTDCLGYNLDNNLDTEDW